MMPIRLAVAVSILFMSACASSPSAPLVDTTHPILSGWKFGHIYQEELSKKQDPTQNAVVLRNTGGSWVPEAYYDSKTWNPNAQHRYSRLDVASGTWSWAAALPTLKAGEREALYFSLERKQVLIYLNKRRNDLGVSNGWHCAAIFSSDDDAIDPCNSSFTTASVGKTIGNTIGGVIKTAGLGLFVTGSTRVLDEELLDELVRTVVIPGWEQANFNAARTYDELQRFIAHFTPIDVLRLVPKAQANLGAAKVASYEPAFQQANDLPQLRSFVATYQDYDPKGLVSQARAKLAQIERQEELERQELARRIAEGERIEAEKRRIEAERQSQIKRQQLALMSQRGQRVCRKEQMTFQAMRETRDVTFMGFVEDFADSRLRITVAAVDGLCSRGTCLNAATYYQGMPMQQGTVLWDHGNNWYPC